MSPNSAFTNHYLRNNQVRFHKTLAFLDKHLKKGDRILDLGPTNPLVPLMRDKGYEVTNTAEGVDLDFQPDLAHEGGFDAVTAFEILEHMVNPFSVLKDIKAEKLFVSVPLKLWFSKAYWNEKDPYDRHFHEFEARQFNMLLNKAGWKIIASEKWAHGTTFWGFRPILRHFTDRYYLVYCKRK